MGKQISIKCSNHFSTPYSANTAKANIELNQGCFLATTTVDVFRGPIVTTDLASKFRDVLIGGEIGYDSTKGNIDKYSVSLGLDRAPKSSDPSFDGL